MIKVMRIIPFVVMFIVLLQLVDAGEIFNDEIKDNVLFTINDIEHVARYYPSAKKVSMKAGEDRTLIEVEDCATIGDLKYCIDSADEGINEETGDPMSTMQLRVLQSGPEVSISRSVSDEHPNLNQEVEVTATLTNTGNERATNINYEDNFPVGVKVSSSYYNMLKNGVLWSGSLNPEETKTITYKLTFQEFLTYDSVAKASFLFNNKVNKRESKKVNFKVQTPYEISDSISAKSVDIGDEITYTISINSSDDTQDITVDSLEVTIPSGTTVSHRSIGLELDGSNKVKFSGKIVGGSSEELSFRFKSMKIAEGELKATVRIRVGSKTFTEEFSHKIGVGVSEIMPEIKFVPDEVKGGGEVEVEAKITNEGEDTISDISLDMSGDFVEPRGWRKLELEKGDKHYAVNKMINAPATDVDRDYFIKLSGSYRRASGKIMNFETMEKIHVIAQDKLVELTPEFRVDGKKVNVTLTVKNVAPYVVTYVSLIDTVPKGFQVSGGERYVDIEEMAIGEERVAYSYIITVPDNYISPSFSITHIFNGIDKDDDKLMTESKSTVVLTGGTEDSEKDVEASDENKTDDTTTAAENTGDATEEDGDKKPGVFKRMWSWIKGLFSKDSVIEEDKFE